MFVVPFAISFWWVAWSTDPETKGNMIMSVEKCEGVSTPCLTNRVGINKGEELVYSVPKEAPASSQAKRPRLGVE